MRRLAKKSLYQIQPYIPGTPIEEVKRKLGLRHVIKLASNENPYGPSPKVRQAISRAAFHINRYPESDCFYLRQAIAKKLKVQPQQLIFGNGSDEIINMAIKAFVQEGDEVIIAKPSFLIYALAARIAGAKLKEIPLKNFFYDLEGMKKSVTKRTKMIFLGNPDNPSGKYLTTADLKKFFQGLSQDLLVFIDEAYFEYVTAKDYVDSLALLKKHDNLIVTRTFSKMYGLAGLRVGYGVAHPEIIDVLNRIREPFNINSLAQAAALACLKDPGYYSDIARKMQVERRYLYRELQKLGLPYVESFANFILIKIQSDAKGVVQGLLKNGVIIRDMNFWGLQNYMRVTIGSQPENRMFVQKLKKVLQER